ncbi:acyl carrier protein [Anaerobacterium chartisolvens]|uniref:Acyl carrier protein n=1 Tax=Anaerobacterium chartisolvens TaxID=1297424 RepID=A0A369ALG4_9FIRM|nr:acyl carrier protein [Anaerobacterium chartisolvens]RCX09935.1 acyl carrier protein [Anaerobacterium chartisolvens]
MQLREEILEKIIERASGLFNKSQEELNADTRLAEDLEAKSVNYSQIITFLEDEFEVEIPFMDFRRKKTLGEAAAFVEGIMEG